MESSIHAGPLEIAPHYRRCSEQLGYLHQMARMLLECMPEQQSPHLFDRILQFVPVNLR
jgi:hypothetical protein